MEYTQEEKDAIGQLKVMILDKLIAGGCPWEEIPRHAENLFQWFADEPTKYINGQPVKVII